MESDIILEGFLKAECTHGLRYTNVIADGDSSVYARLQEEVPVWGKEIQKIECANHICKCLRGSLEKLVTENPLYKGKNNLPKSTRQRLTSAVRCAIRVRSSEPNKKEAAQKLEHDIRNSVHHIYGNHTRCSDFCRAVIDKTPTSIDDTYNERCTEDDDTIPGVISGISQLWSDTTSLDLQDESRNSLSCNLNLDAMILRDISILLDRVASKSSRLIGNHTTNLAESWMSVRAKFDGGKLYNRCNRGSWHSRCFGGCLRFNLGPKWSSEVWEKTTATEPGYFFRKLYDRRQTGLDSCKKSKNKPEVQARRWKRKYSANRESTCKKARQDYGPEALESCADITSVELESKSQKFLNNHIYLSEEKIKCIEKSTKKQSISAVWLDERKKRITASNFGSVIRRNPSLIVKKFVKNLLYSNFKGNVNTRRGLHEEAMTIKEYEEEMKKQQKKVSVIQVGLVISRKNKYLAASPDGKVVERKMNPDGEVVQDNAEVGLLEMKNLLHAKPLNLYEAAEEVNNFCLLYDGKKLALKKNHDYYYQVQGQLNVTELPWADFVVRTMNPYQMHIERIYIDRQLWQNTMLPKLQAFYFKVLLPELASPRYNTISGIREPGNWFIDGKCTSSTRSHRKQKLQRTQSSTESATPAPGSHSNITATPAPGSSVSVTATPAPRPSVSVTATPAAQPSVSVTAPPAPRPSVSVTATPPPGPSVSVTATPAPGPSSSVRATPAPVPLSSATVSPVPGPSSSVTVTPPPDPVSSVINRSRRRTKVKFVGRRISHEWVEDETVNQRKWYNGTVVGTTSGKDGDPGTVYEVIYDDDDATYSVDDLLEDLNASSLKFIDL